MSASGLGFVRLGVSGVCLICPLRGKGLFASGIGVCPLFHWGGVVCPLRGLVFVRFGGEVLSASVVGVGLFVSLEGVGLSAKGGGRLSASGDGGLYALAFVH